MPHPLRLAAIACALACLLRAGGPAAWESNSWPDFLKGRFSGISLTRDGRLTLAPRLELLATTEEGAVWAVVRASDGALWFATGHRGRLYRLAAGAAADARPQPVWIAQQPEIFALAAAPGGAVFAATSPGGDIWRVDAAGKAEQWFSTKSKYVWSLAVAADGALFAGSGDDGRVWRVNTRGQGGVWYETGQSHVTCLAFDNAGALLAGSEPNGNLYRISAQNRASVLLHATLPEIRDVLALSDGSVLAAALGGGLTQKQSQAAAAAAASMAAVPTLSTTITVTADTSARSGLGPAAPAQTGLELKPPAQRTTPGAGEVPATPPASAPVEVAGVEKSALYRIAPDLTIETIWSSKEENLLGLALQRGTPYVSTDLRGRVYSIAPNARTALVLETGEGETTRLLDTPGGLLAATGTLARLFALSAVREHSGWYESPVFDSGTVARWGRLEWRGDLAGAHIAFRTRSGNSARPDKTWSDWSEPLGDPATARLRSPNARYVQWRVEIHSAPPSADAASVSIRAVSLSYQPQNNRPVVRSITVTPQWVAAPQRSSAAQASSGPASPFSVTVTDSGDSGPATTSGTPTQQINRGGVLQLFLSWQADDPDNDRLVYTLQVRGEGEREWKTLKAELTDNTYTLEADSLADGRYRFRVIASDRPSNPPSQAREADLESAPVLLDQTPPVLTLAEPRRSTEDGSEWLAIEVEAVDALSPVRRAEVSIDAGPWRPMECADGVADSLRERFLVRLSAPPAGEHLVTVRVYDASGNAGLARRVIR
ncbi:MAG: hypothetical protein ACLQBJ_14775 [Bryobacteraceae bacterium]